MVDIAGHEEMDTYILYTYIYEINIYIRIFTLHNITFVTLLLPTAPSLQIINQFDFF